MRYFVRAVAYWTPLALRTIAYGLGSCVIGPFTGGRFSRVCMRRWCVDTLKQLHVDIDVKGLEHLRRAAPAVLASNHVSSLDILILGAVLDVDYKWAAKRILFYMPFLGWHLRIAGHVPVERKRGNALAKLDAAFGDRLRGGSSILIFPEGTRSDDGRLKPFRSGAFVTAVNHRVPVVPIAIAGSAELLPKNEWCLDESVSKTVTVRILPAVEHDAFEGVSSAQRREHAARALRDAVWGLLDAELRDATRPSPHGEAESALPAEQALRIA